MNGREVVRYGDSAMYFCIAVCDRREFGQREICD
jgi:hypothetical protein